ncbi:MAG TPA: glycoside hydrolase family 36 protein [Candidatus Dormibacteraeota bacterium]|nr:glycoside hydrolase family 36 protein [Candidatus Dormibacteraeota bacterium]
MPFRDIAEARLGPHSRVYEHGWQSWSPTGAYPATATSPRPSDARVNTVHFRGRELPADGFQAEGLLAFDPGDGGPVRLWSAPDASREVPSIRAHARNGSLVISADSGVKESSYESGLWDALAAWAEDFARNAGVGPLHAQPPFWCSWYHYFTEVREEDILENLAGADSLGLDIGVVQIDDGWEAEIGDWLERSPRFPHPLPETTKRIKATGRRAGIWTAPVLVGERSRIAHEHPDWLVRGVDAGRNWDEALFALDVTHPDAAAYLVRVFRTLTEWGFDFFKVDFMYSGALEGGRHGDADGVAAYRQALRLIREAIGPEATLLGCGAPILPSVGLVDVMRVSPDTGPNYEPMAGDVAVPSQRSAVLAGRARAFQQGRFWINDPDCLIVRPDVERREEWALHVERYGALRGSSDRLKALDAWGLETTRRLLNPASIAPFDLSGLEAA